MSEIEKRFDILMSLKHDITEHLGLLRGLSMSCINVVEFGFRGGESATAILAGGANLMSYDIRPCDDAVILGKLVGKQFKFMWQSSLKANIPECDMLFIDSLHTGAQLQRELEMHHHKVHDRIVMHDTETFGKIGQDGKKPGLMTALEDFVDQHKEWRCMFHLKNNNGLTILERVDD